MADREKVIKAYEDFVNGYECFCTSDDYEYEMHKAVLALLKEQEAVVRCKDCKWWDKKDDSNYGYCHACKHGYHSDHWEIGIYRTYKGDWFCADGERKDE